VKDAKQLRKELDERLIYLVDNITFEVFNYSRRGLFDRHKLILATQLTIKVLSREGKLKDSEVAFLLSGPGLKANSPPMTTQVALYISEAQWSGVFALVAIVEPLKPLIDDLEQNYEAWKEWVESELPEDKVQGQLPGEWEKKLTLFQRLLLIRVMRPDQIDTQVERTLASNDDSVILAEPEPRAAALHHLARDLMPQHQALGRRGAPAHHVLVAAANVGRHHLQDHAVVALALLLLQLQLGVVDGAHLRDARLHVHHAPVGVVLRGRGHAAVWRGGARAARPLGGGGKGWREVWQARAENARARESNAREHTCPGAPCSECEAVECARALVAAGAHVDTDLAAWARRRAASIRVCERAGERGWVKK
jgi:hypothetical protein